MTSSPPDIRQKWDRIYREADTTPPGPARVLAEFEHLLPAVGTALDLASGLGGNALFLAQRGLDTSAFDISKEAIVRLNSFATRLGLSIRTEIRDVVNTPPPPQSFDVIVVSRFLERSLAPAIIDALKPQGLLYYQTFIREKTSEAGPGNPAYRLEANELLGLFGELRVLVYREEGRIGDLHQGFRDEAYLIGQKSCQSDR
jgi:tellurite methyltransferase